MAKTHHHRADFLKTYVPNVLGEDRDSGTCVVHVMADVVFE